MITLGEIVVPVVCLLLGIVIEWVIAELRTK